MESLRDNFDWSETKFRIGGGRPRYEGKGRPGTIVCVRRDGAFIVEVDGFDKKNQRSVDVYLASSAAPFGSEIVLDWNPAWFYGDPHKLVDDFVPPGLLKGSANRTLRKGIWGLVDWVSMGLTVCRVVAIAWIACFLLMFWNRSEEGIYSSGGILLVLTFWAGYLAGSPSSSEKERAG